jgi:hypothetical protein
VRDRPSAIRHPQLALSSDDLSGQRDFTEANHRRFKVEARNDTWIVVDTAGGGHAILCWTTTRAQANKIAGALTIIVRPYYHSDVSYVKQGDGRA